MRKKVPLLLVLFFLQMSLVVYSQQEAQYTHYMYNTANVNPGYAGSRGVLSVLVMHRDQWVGLDGSPKTNTITAHSPLDANGKLGLGVSFVNDKLGPSAENTVSVDFSYSLSTSDHFKLAFGLKATADFFDVDFSRLNSRDLGDPLIRDRNTIDNRFFPNIGAGMYWYSENTYLGLSVPYILESKYYDNDIQYAASEKAHFHLIAGHVSDLSSEIKFKPALLVKVVKGAPLQMDLSANFLFHEKLTLGLAYRWSAAVSALAGFQISKLWLIGYAYDRDTTKLGDFNSGSHEIFLRYEFFREYDKMRSPRFF